MGGGGSVLWSFSLPKDEAKLDEEDVDDVMQPEIMPVLPLAADEREMAEEATTMPSLQRAAQFLVNDFSRQPLAALSAEAERQGITVNTLRSHLKAAAEAALQAQEAVFERVASYIRNACQARTLEASIPHTLGCAEGTPNAALLLKDGALREPSDSAGLQVYRLFSVNVLQAPPTRSAPEST